MKSCNGVIIFNEDTFRTILSPVERSSSFRGDFLWSVYT